MTPRTRLFLKRRPAVGSRPGTLVADACAHPTTVRWLRFTATELSEGAGATEDADATSILWLDVRGLAGTEQIRALGERFGVHPLAIEDVVNVPQRPKVQLFPAGSRGPQYFFVFRAVHYEPHRGLAARQVSLLLGTRFVLSFEETADSDLEPIRRRLHEGLGLIRSSSADYLAYALIDAVIDGYYPVLESIANEIEELEELVLRDTTPEVLHRLQSIKRSLILLRRAVWPSREALASLRHDASELISESTRVYLRDVQDHCVQIAEVIESYRDLVSELTNTNLAVASNRTNEIMKVLTIMASIFIPLTFLAGVYGMNFQGMPELHMRYGYPLVLGAMLLSSTGMLMYFRRKGWIGGESGSDEDERG